MSWFWLCGTVLAVSTLGACSSDAKTKADDVHACRNIAAINKSLNDISTDLHSGKRLFATIRTQAHALIGSAPESLREDARALAAAIDKVKPIVDRTRTIEQLHRLEQTDTTLQSAMSDLLISADHLREWRVAHCK